ETNGERIFRRCRRGERGGRTVFQRLSARHDGAKRGRLIAYQDVVLCTAAESRQHRDQRARDAALHLFGAGKPAKPGAVHRGASSASEERTSPCVRGARTLASVHLSSVKPKVKLRFL